MFRLCPIPHCHRPDGRNSSRTGSRDNSSARGNYSSRGGNNNNDDDRRGGGGGHNDRRGGNSSSLSSAAMRLGGNSSGPSSGGNAWGSDAAMRMAPGAAAAAKSSAAAAATAAAAAAAPSAAATSSGSTSSSAAGAGSATPVSAAAQTAAQAAVERTEPDDKARDRLRALASDLLSRHCIGEASLVGCDAELAAVPVAHRWAAVRELHNEAVENSRLAADDRHFGGRVCVAWVQSGALTEADYARGLGEYLVPMADLVIDIPKVWSYTVELLGEWKYLAVRCPFF